MEKLFVFGRQRSKGWVSSTPEILELGGNMEEIYKNLHKVWKNKIYL
jgi:hypothetical protein